MKGFGTNYPIASYLTICFDEPATQVAFDSRTYIESGRRRGRKEMRCLTVLLLLLYCLGFSISLCVAETGAKRVARRSIAPAEPPQGGPRDVVQAPITATEVEQTRRQRDVVLPKLEQLYQQPWAKEYLGALNLEQIKQRLAQSQAAQEKEPRPPQPQRQRNRLDLTLQQSIEIALQKNLRVQIARLTRDTVQPEVRRAKARFHPNVGLAFIASDNRSFSQTVGEPASTSNTQAVTSFIEQAVPTGASVIVSSDLNRNEIKGEDPPQTFGAALRVRVVQPLLRGGGVVVATRPIRDAEFDLGVEEARLRAEILRITAATKSAYYNVVLAERIIVLIEEAIQRDKTLIEASKALFEAGIVTKRDVFSAELSLARDSKSLVDAQANRAVATNVLLDTLGLPFATQVALLDKDLSIQPVQMELERWIATALTNRPEIVEFEQKLGKSSLSIRVARNTVFPQLDLVGLYEKAQNASVFGRSFDLQGQAWSVGLVFSVPIGNVAAKAALTSAETGFTLLQQELLQTKRQIELEVRTNVIQLRQSLERIQPLTVEIEQAKGKLDIAKARFALGQATNFDITDAQETLLDAERELLEAVVEYNIALARLEASVAGPI
jgi:outer membrane protein TolC